MADDEMISKIVEAARTIFKQPDLTYDPAMTFRSIRGFDSVLAIQFILAIEKAFGIMIAEDEVDRMHTFGDLVSILESKG